MTLTSRNDIRAMLCDSTYAARDTDKPLPKYRFPDDEHAPRDILQLVDDELLLDGNPRQNLAAFCQTFEEPELYQIMQTAIDRNMFDKSAYPQVAGMETRCLHMLASLGNAPEGEDAVGTSTIGSSEACMLGGMAAKWRWRARRPAAANPVDKTNLVCGPVQVCWEKFCRCLDMASLFLADMCRAIAHFETHPVTASLTQEYHGGYTLKRLSLGPSRWLAISALKTPAGSF